ncbi:MAG: hypothetical protein CL858_28405 [Cupriavidus sp.]|uniref:Uncharacterized protein n=1 Tax=Methylobacterium brachiatum TaxID=269660 RepID=A0AAJ1TR90_9HYPH|nr:MULTISPECIES: hypothetical protein [Methylobacterium]MBU69309.1 hypothetical protein [Cupriavidus sp.]EIZ84816.1 hypothetical protein WYO_2500 [Methylobacterium sp. GXF4]MBP31658.1 hypothetical protein [Methylobacterium sp.]MCB4804596.1 hypothetical protein [Methylobacterium brachiatum]MDQ0545632.1 hypothetical protein [Methylobacterium brachiatum]
MMKSKTPGQMPTSARSAVADRMRLLKHMRAGQSVSVLDVANFLRCRANHGEEWIGEEIVEVAGVAHSLNEEVIVTASFVTLTLRLQQGGSDR